MRIFACLLMALMAAALAAQDQDYPPVVGGRALMFPRDHGSHPEYRTEWWYITGWAKDSAGREFGVQVTFFRNRPRVAEDNPSAFAPRQLLFAHAALADPGLGKLRHDERAARAGFDLAYARDHDTDIAIGGWSLRRRDGGYVAQVEAKDFALALQFEAEQEILVQGEGGYSRKGPQPAQASFYYSIPQLKLSGELEVDGSRFTVTGTAWLDHEWSSELMAVEATGWDWVGLNFDDGSALMAFRMRDRRGDALWQAATYRTASGHARAVPQEAIQFLPSRTWRSPRTGANYPVGMTVAVDGVRLELEPLFDDQELDARASTGTIYWEGAVRAKRHGAIVGRGYLELTGYWKPLRL